MNGDPVLRPVPYRKTKFQHAEFLRALALGLPGIGAVFLLVMPPDGVPAIALAVNPMILLCAAAIAGSLAARRIGLASALLLGDAIPKRHLALAFALGVALGSTLAGLDCATAFLWRGHALSMRALCEQTDAASLVLGILYGGVTEELIMRWGLLSIVALGFSRLMPLSWSLVSAMIVAAALFALLHLPTLWLVVSEPSTALLIRTMALNALAGLMFGAAYLRVGLEGAMLAHIGFHCGAAALSLAIAPPA